MDPTDIRKLLTHAQQAAPFENAYSVYMYIMFVFSTLLTVISLYLFLNRRSKLHGELRAIVTHTTISSFAMTSTMTLWQIVVLPPYVGGYSVGIIFRKIGPYSFLLGLWICWSCVIHLGVTYTLGFSIQCFRMKISGQEGCLGRIFEWFLMGQGQNAKNFLRFCAVLHFTLALVPIISLSWYTIPISNQPSLVNLVKEHPSLILVSIRDNFIFLASILVCAIVVTVEIIYCMKTNCSTFRAVRRTSEVVTQRTLNMQMHMYQIFSLQILMIIIFYYIPTLIACLHMFELIDLKNFSTVNICFMLWHCPIQSMISLLGYPGIRKKISSITTSINSKIITKN